MSSGLDTYHGVTTSESERLGHGPIAMTPGNRRAAVVDAILQAVSQSLKDAPLPLASYRFQFNSSFTFRNGRDLIPYLSALGISHCYASPYLKARAGSRHGYDILDHNSLNTEIGSSGEYDEFIELLHRHGMGQILDVVPNHMGVDSSNAWWLDVLENGPSSPFASYFDIDWMPLKPDLAHKVLLPILGDQFGKVLEDQQLVLHYENGSFWVRYFDHRLPIAARSLGILLRHRIEDLQSALGAENPQMLEFHSILTAISHMPSRTESDGAKVNEALREKEVIKRRIAQLSQASPEVLSFIESNVRLFNGSRGDPRSFDLFDQLLQAQAYRLSYWRVAADEINYRRFFDVNEMAAVCMENAEVFERAHGLILRLLAEGKVNGLRIDHPDGLNDPAEYLKRLQQARFLALCHEHWTRLRAEHTAIQSDAPAQADTGDDYPEWEQIERDLMTRFDRTNLRSAQPPLARPLFIIVEKILAPSEQLPENWPVNGTTGYEFLNVLNGVFVDQVNARAFDRIYSQFVRGRTSYRELVYQSKKLIMQVSLASEISVLGHQLDRISEHNRRSRDFTLRSLTDAISEVVACFPVYRTYIGESGILDRDRQYVETAVARAKRKNPAISASIFDFVRDTLLLKYPESADDAARAAQRRFVGKFQQVTPAIMAKAVEDTAFYSFNRLVSLNEVGDDPEKFGVSVAAFHQHNQERRARWPHSMLCTSTHDTKRGEDVRARINVLSEIPHDWRTHVFRWSRWNQRKKTNVDGEPAPSRNDEYLLYQTLIGTWPCHGANRSERNQFVDRIQNYMLKATREAKVHTSWISPNEPYEHAVRTFIAKLLAEHPKNSFLADFEPFARRVADCGLWNSLAQTLLKVTCPGVPDIYQGSELLDLRLVDPDNRMPVDYKTRTNLLRSMQTRIQSAQGNLCNLTADLVAERDHSQLKFYVLLQTLNYRRTNSKLFTHGDYMPLTVTGAERDRIVAFARTDAQQTAIIVAPRLCVPLSNGPGNPPCGAVWRDTCVSVPQAMLTARIQNVLTGEAIDQKLMNAHDGIPVSQLFRSIPVALLFGI
jgi:(1->4)-alpha-D-glucan 1-alpha-D-glucosylmutase